MSGEPDTGADARIVAWQVGRAPREPWRVAARCEHDRPTVIVSPGLLGDGTPFPTWAWLSCPHLCTQVSDVESAGGTADWTARVATDADLAAAVLVADDEFRKRRDAEGAAVHTASSTGLAGQRDPLVVKCLHARVALALAGVPDPVGTQVLGALRPTCADDRCGESGADAARTEAS